MIRRILPLILSIGLFTIAPWCSMATLHAQEKNYWFNEWEVLYSPGSPLGTSKWRSVDNAVYYQNFAQIGSVSFLHQFSAKDFGAATEGYRYPSMGFFLEWVDMDHVRLHGKEPLVSADKRYKFGQIASAGFVLHQTCWVHGKWSGRIKMQDGAAYVFDPVFGEITTMSKPWQFLLSCAWLFDYEVGNSSVISFGPQITHMSNSGLSDYNAGINNFSLSVAYSQRAPKKQSVCKKEDALVEKDGSTFRPHLYGSFVAGLGWVYYEHSEKGNGQSTLMADVMYRLTPTHGLGLGVDYYHNAQPDRTGHTEYFGTALKYDHWWGGFVFHVQVGAYIGNRRPIKWKGLSRIYENIGYKYVFCRTRPVAPYVGVYTKGNGFNAEQMAFSIGAIIK